MTAAAAGPADRVTRRGAPVWLVLATAAMALLILLLAVAETSVTVAWLVDTRGEVISLAGVAFILVAGLVVRRQGRLSASLPLVLPWLLYPIVTQGDQIIDNLSIEWMRTIVTVLLVAIFVAPVAVVALSARAWFDRADGRARHAGSILGLVPGLRQLAEGRRRLGSALLVAALLAVEIPLALLYVGALLIYCLTAIIVGTLAWASQPEPEVRDAAVEHARAERFAFIVLLAGVVISAGTFIGYRNAPGAYQGSPSFFMDPSQQDKNYPLDRVAVPAADPATPADPAALEAALTDGVKAFNDLAASYNVLGRNYTWDFHNELFLRHDVLLRDYREVGVGGARDAAEAWTRVRPRLAEARAQVPSGDPLAAFLDDVLGFGDFNVRRTPTLAHMSLSFQRTKAGLQHAAHLYEGEAKYLGDGLAALVRKHGRVVDAPALRGVMREFVLTSRTIHDAYANRIVGY